MELKNNKKWLLFISWVVASFWIMPLNGPSFAKQKVQTPAAQTDIQTEIGPAQEPVEEKNTPESKKEKYVYNPAGKTDPFESFLKKAGGVRGKSLSAGGGKFDDVEAIMSTSEPETELEKIELSKLTLTSVMKGKNKVWAMVVDPKGRGYFIEKGTKIGMQSGFVDEIVCEEKRTDLGLETVRKVVVKVPYRDRNRNIIYRSIEMEMAHTSM